LNGDGVPNEEAQYDAYKKAAESLSDRPLVIRTFDFGADKDPGGLNECSGRNPALGMRGIRRHLLLQPDELRQQMRAILRAAVHGDISILLPVVTNLQDILLARGHLQEAKSELERTGTPHNPKVRLGAMVEIPSAALQIDQILDAVDFVSIGTNDLLQYLTASDRDNPNVLHYQQPDTAGLYRLLTLIIQAAQAKDRVEDVCVCGEMASEPEAAVALVKIGFRCLSVTPATADRVRMMLNA
jgi:phosphotransferase system enzyme I (PtsI)